MSKKQDLVNILGVILSVFTILVLWLALLSSFNLFLIIFGIFLIIVGIYIIFR